VKGTGSRLLRSRATVGILVGVVLAVSHAVVRAEGQVETAVGGGARALSLGEGGAAASTGVESLFWTPAGVAEVAEPEFLLGHTSWVEGLNLEAAAAVVPLGEPGVIGMVGSWQTFGGIEERDAGGNLVRTFSLTTASASAAFARPLSSHAFVGLSVGFRIQNGSVMNEKVVPFGLGVGWQLDNVRIGASAQGLLAPMPAYQVSAAWRGRAAGLGFLVTGGAILRQGEDRAGIGVESMVGRILRVRVGYVLPLQKSDLRTFSNLGAGFGLTYRALGFDYAFLPLGDLGQVHRIQMSLKLPRVEAIPVVTAPPM